MQWGDQRNRLLPLVIMAIRRTTALVLALLGGALLLPGTSAARSAVGLPPCPGSNDLVTTFVPDYARAGSGIEIELAIAQRSRVTSLSVTASNNQPTTVIEVPVEKPRTSIVTLAGSRGILNLSVRWEQEVESPAGCVGRDDHAIPVVPPEASVGTREAGRLVGAFSIREIEIAPARSRWIHNVWTLSPTCDVFACPTRVRSTGTLAGSFLPKPNGSYELSHIFPLSGAAGECVVTTTYTNSSGTGKWRKVRRYKHAFEYQIRVELIPTKVDEGGRVVAFRGTIAQTYIPTPRGRRKGCHRSYRYREKLLGTLR